MLKFIDELAFREEFQYLPGGGITFRQQADGTSIAMDQLKGSLGRFNPFDICSVGEGMRDDFASRQVQAEMGGAHGVETLADHVNMTKAHSEGRIYILDPVCDADDFAYRFIVITPHSMDRFDKVDVVDAWFVNELGRMKPESCPLPAPCFKRTFSDVGYFVRDEKLLSGLYDSSGVIAVKNWLPDESEESAPKVDPLKGPRELSFVETNCVINHLKSGGAFASHLGEALAAADSANTKILTAAFWPLFSKLLSVTGDEIKVSGPSTTKTDSATVGMP